MPGAFPCYISKTMSESMEVEFYKLSLCEGDQRGIARNVGWSQIAEVTNTKLGTSIFHLLSNRAISLPFVSVLVASP